MKILLVGHDDNGGGSWFTAQAINRYTNHEARQYRTYQNRLEYPYHRLKPPDELCYDWIKWADVIHARGTLRPLPNKWTANKPVVMTYSGNNWRLKTDKMLQISQGRGDVITVSTWDLPFYAPDVPVFWLPNPREDLSGCVSEKHERFTVCHAPTDRSWKGTDTLIEAMNRLPDVDLDLIERTTYSECLQRKAKCHLVMDQFSYGYGNNGIEGWALGLPVIGDVQGNPGYPFPQPVDLRQFFLDLCGFLPFVQVAEDTQVLREAIEHLRDDPQSYQKAIEHGRAYFFAYHHAPAVAKRTVGIYEMALDAQHGQSYALKPTPQLKAPAAICRRELNILSLATWDHAGCGYFLSEAINQTTCHHSRAVVWEDWGLSFPHDIFNPSLDKFRDLWKWADVVHIHDAVGLRHWQSKQLKDVWDKLPPEELMIASLPPKPTVITYHGARYRKDPKKHNKEAERNGWLTTCSTLDLATYGPRWLPDCRPNLSKYVNRPPGRFIVCQAPVRRRSKGTETVIEATQNLDFDLIENMPWQECVERKGHASVYIDQFRWGYGCNSIEAWSMGMPSIANLGVQSVLDLLRQRIGYLPFVRCPAEPQAIRQTVERLRDDSAFYREAVERGQDCYHRFHSPEAAARQALAYYHEALLRGPAVIDRKVAAIKYINGQGDTSWTGRETGKRYVFRSAQVCYVCAADVPGFLAVYRDHKPQFEVVGW